MFSNPFLEKRARFFLYWVGVYLMGKERRCRYGYKWKLKRFQGTRYKV